MKYLEFEKHIGKSSPQPLYVFYGSENFLKQEGVTSLKKHLGEDRLFFKEYDVGDSFSIQTLMADLYTDALFDDFNFLILQQADAIAVSLAAPLEKYLRGPNPNSILVILLDKLDKRSKFAKMVLKKAVCVECLPLFDRPAPWLNLPPWESEVVQWVCHRARLYKKTIDKQAAFALTESAGKGLKDLDSQLQKLALFIKERDNISVEDIEKIVHTSKRAEVFDLIDAIWEHNIANAIKLTRQVFTNGIQAQDGSPVYDSVQISLQLLRLLHYRVKQMWKVAIVGDTTGVPPFVQKKLLQYRNRFSKADLIRIWRELADTEWMLKSSRCDAALTIEQLVIKISGT